MQGSRKTREQHGEIAASFNEQLRLATLQDVASYIISWDQGWSTTRGAQEVLFESLASEALEDLNRPISFYDWACRATSP